MSGAPHAKRWRRRAGSGAALQDEPSSALRRATVRVAHAAARRVPTARTRPAPPRTRPDCDGSPVGRIGQAGDAAGRPTPGTERPPGRTFLLTSQVPDRTPAAAFGAGALVTLIAAAVGLTVL